MRNESEFNKYLDPIRKKHKREKRNWVKIVTVSLSDDMRNDIDMFRKDTYPSGSEIIRVAVHDFLKHEMKVDNEFTQKREIEVENELNHNVVKVPISKGIYREYNIIKRLE